MLRCSSAATETKTATSVLPERLPGMARSRRPWRTPRLDGKTPVRAPHESWVSDGTPGTPGSVEMVRVDHRLREEKPM